MSVLDELVAGALEDKCDRERVTSLEELKARAASAPAPLDAKRWLRRHDGIPVIAEHAVMDGVPYRHTQTKGANHE